MTKATVQIDSGAGAQPMRLDRIRIEDRLRAVDPDHVAWIARSMADTGQQQPIIVSETDDGFLLVAGAHRLEAARILGWKTIVTVLATGNSDELRLVEIDENLARRNLSALDRAIALGERKRVYEALHPQTRNGGDRKSTEKKEKNQMGIMPIWSADDGEPGRFTLETARKLGFEESAIKRAVRIAAALAPELREALTGHAIANNQAQLLKLVKLPPEQRGIAVDLLTRAEDPAATVQDAISIIERRPAPKHKPAYQKQYDTLYRTFHGANAKAKRMFLKQLLADGELDAVIAAATRTGEAG